MKKQLLTSILATSLISTPWVQAETASELSTQEQKISYIMGLDVGARMESLGYNLDKDAFLTGLKETALATGRSLSDEELQLTMQQAQALFQQRQQEQLTKQAEANESAGQAFLSSNATKEGVNTTDSGLQYKIIEAGDQQSKPKASDTVQVHYRGTLIDGTEFDSSYSHGGPATFPLDGVIAGWTEGLQLIGKGGKAELYIPSELAYGPRGMGQVIGPNSTLVFEVELLDINPGQ